MKRTSIGVLLVAAVGWAQTNDLAPVVSKQISRSADLPGEFVPFLSVTLHARLPGFVERVLVDRGSQVEQGQLLVELSAPEMAAQLAEAESKVQAIEADRIQAEAQLAALQATYDRLKKAAETPGAVAGNELVQIAKQAEAARALVNSRQQAGRAAQAAVETQRQLQSYLKITAPFDGMVTERLIHPGALVGTGKEDALLVIQQIKQLRLVTAVPEEYVGSIADGAKLTFQVPAYPERIFSGTVARSSHALDKSTRTMAVELDVANRDGALSPGMYPTVKWPIHRTRPGLFVPKTSVVTTTERTFVVRSRDGRTEWVDVRKGSAEGDLIEVLGDLKAGDLVVRRATDEMREGAAIGGPANQGTRR